MLETAVSSVLRIVWMLVTGTILLGGSVYASKDDVDEVPPAANQVNEGFEVAEENFDQWIYQGAANAQTGRERIKARLKIHLDELDRICSLTPEQKQKLTLAAQGDMKRLFDQIEVVRIKFRAVRKNQNAFNEIWNDINPLRQKINSDLFSEKSFYGKTLRTTLTPEQFANYEVMVNERRQFRYRASIAVAFTNLEKIVPLKNSQRQVLMEMVLLETKPPRSFGSHDYQLVLLQLSRFPEDRYKKVLDDRQWKLLEGHIAQYRGIEQSLIQQGIIDKADIVPLTSQNDDPADATNPSRPGK